VEETGCINSSKVSNSQTTNDGDLGNDKALKRGANAPENIPGTVSTVSGMGSETVETVDNTE